MPATEFQKRFKRHLMGIAPTFDCFDIYNIAFTQILDIIDLLMRLPEFFSQDTLK